MKRLADRYLLAFDNTFNTYRKSLGLEEWAGVVGLDPERTTKLRLYLEAKGIL